MQQGTGSVASLVHAADDVFTHPPFQKWTIPLRVGTGGCENGARPRHCTTRMTSLRDIPTVRKNTFTNQPTLTLCVTSVLLLPHGMHLRCYVARRRLSLPFFHSFSSASSPIQQHEQPLLCGTPAQKTLCLRAPQSEQGCSGSATRTRPRRAAGL